MKYLLSIIAFLAASNAFSQIEDPAPPPPQIETLDTSSSQLLEDYDEEIIYDDYPYEVVEAPAVEMPSKPLPFKAFTNLENNPDNKAIYKTGLFMLMKDIENVLYVPYSYNRKAVAKYVFIEVTIGTDSMMYNPNVLYSSSTEYSRYAMTALEKLEGKFVPATKKGKAVVSKIIIPIRFEYDNNY
jgi:hypothetical protein